MMDAEEIKICPECGYDGNNARAKFCSVCGHGFPYFNESGIMRSAISTYGDVHQMLIAIEEMAELIKELCKKYRGFDNLNNIVEELADVGIVADEMKILFDCEEDVQEIRRRKLDRLRRRIAEDRHTEKRYWNVKREGNGWLYTYDSTCPYCKKTFERETPKPYCPRCGQRIDGFVHEYDYMWMHSSGKRHLRHVTELYEFDEHGGYHLVNGSDKNADILFKSEITDEDIDELCYGTIRRTLEETEAPKDEPDETDTV